MTRLSDENIDLQMAQAIRAERARPLSQRITPGEWGQMGPRAAASGPDERVANAKLHAIAPKLLAVYEAAENYVVNAPNTSLLELCDALAAVKAQEPEVGP